MCLVALLFSSVSGYADRDHRRGRGRSEDMDPENREQALELQEREADLRFKQQMRELKLERMRQSFNRHGESRQRFGRGRHPEFRPHSGCPMMKERHHHFPRIIIPFLMMAFVVHILLAIWVYQDIRKKDSDSGIWIVITLLTGLCGAAVYAIVRIGDKK